MSRHNFHHWIVCVVPVCLILYTCTYWIHTVSSSMLELTCVFFLLQVLVPTTLDDFFFPHHQQPSILSSQLTCLPITTLASSQAHHPPLITHHPLPVTHHPPPIGREVNLSSSRLSGASFGSLRLGSPCECVCVCVCVIMTSRVLQFRLAPQCCSLPHPMSSTALPTSGMCNYSYMYMYVHVS